MVEFTFEIEEKLLVLSENDNEIFEKLLFVLFSFLKAILYIIEI